METLTYKNITFSVWDLGGQDSIRPYWRCYYTNTTAALIFVIDSADAARMEIVKKEIEMLLGEQELKGAALLVLANKQDIQGALGEGEIAERLELAKKCKERYLSSLWVQEMLTHRNWSIRACSAIKKEGLTEGFDWYPSKWSFLANIRLVDVINEQHGHK